MLTLGNAARTLGFSKPALSKAIRGHLSAAKRDDGSFAIDLSELARWWEGARHPFQASATGDSQPTTASASGSHSRADPNALHELRVALRELLAAEQGRSDERRRNDERQTQTDQWREQAQRLLLAAPWVTPAPTPASAPAPVTTPPRTPWWGWWRQAS